jgi:hypothetical protein
MNGGFAYSKKKKLAYGGLDSGILRAIMESEFSLTTI